MVPLLVIREALRTTSRLCRKLSLLLGVLGVVPPQVVIVLDYPLVPVHVLLRSPYMP